MVRGKIRIEQVERIVIPKAAKNYCIECRQDRIFLSPEMAAVNYRVSQRELFRLVEAGVIHLIEDRHGLLSICSESLALIAAERFLPTKD